MRQSLFARMTNKNVASSSVPATGELKKKHETSDMGGAGASMKT